MDSASLSEACSRERAPCAALTFRMAAAFDQAHAGGDGALARIGTAVCKYWICKAAPKAVYEAMECHGGNGYVEDSIMPRLFRQSPLNAIWEGSGNVICLDVLRALHKEPASGAALLAEINLARGADARLDATVDKLGAALSTGTPAQLERGARQLVDTMATALAASLLLRHAPSEVADAFCSRLGSGADLGLGFGANHTSNFGTLPEGADESTHSRVKASASWNKGTSIHLEGLRNKPETLLKVV